MKKIDIEKKWKYLQEIKGPNPSECNDRNDADLADTLDLSLKGIVKVCIHFDDVWVYFDSRVDDGEVITTFEEFESLYNYTE